MVKQHDTFIAYTCLTAIQCTRTHGSQMQHKTHWDKRKSARFSCRSSAHRASGQSRSYPYHGTSDGRGRVVVVRACTVRVCVSLSIFPIVCC